jgi:PAS domain S-box-containing protein
MSSVLKSVIHNPASATGPLHRSSTGYIPEVFSSPSGSDISDDLDQVVGVLVENAPVAMAVFDNHMCYILANRQWMVDFNLERSASIVGRSQYEVFPHLHAGWRAVYERALQGHVVRSEHEVPSPSGRPTTFRWELRPWRNTGATGVAGIMVTCEKFTPPLSQEASSPATAASDATLSINRAAALPNATIPMLLVDAVGVVHDANEAAQVLAMARGLRLGESYFWDVFDGGPTLEITRQRTLGLIAMTLVQDPLQSQGLAPTHLSITDPVNQVQTHWSAYHHAGEPARVLMLVSTPAPTMPVAEPAAGLVATLQLDKRRAEENLSVAMDEIQRMKEVQETFQRRETRLKEVFDTMPVGLLVLDARGRPTYHNKALRQILGRGLESGQSIEEWIGKAALDKEHREAITRVWRESVWRRQLTRVLSLKANTGVRDVEFQPISLSQGGLMIRIEDVTDSSRREEVLRSSEAKFRTVLGDAPTAIILTDIAGSINEVNSTTEALLGKSKQELRMSTVDEWLDKESAELRRNEVLRLAEGGSLGEDFSVYLEPVQQHVMLRVASVQDSEGKLHSIVHFFYLSPEAAPAEIEEESVKQQELEEEEEAESTAPYFPQLAAPEATALELLLETDAQGRISQWTGLAQQRFGWTAKEMTSEPVHKIFRPSDGSGFYATVAEALVLGTEQVSWPWFGKTGKGEATLQLRATAQGGLGMGLYVPSPVVKDIRLELPQLVASRRSELVDLNRERLFLTEANHRVKNHLQILASMMNLEGAKVDDPRAKRALRSSQNRIRAVASLHQHLQDLQQLKPSKLDDFVRQLVGRLCECHGMTMSQVNLSTSITPMAIKPEWMLPIVLILNEAVTNSLQHSFAAAVQDDIATRQLRLSIKLESLEDKQVGSLTVQDDGIGLPEGFGSSEISGLGLKIINVFADQLGGRVSLENIKPAGMRFILHFPMTCVDI